MFKRFRKTLATYAAALAMVVIPAAIPVVASAQVTEEPLKCGTTLNVDNTTGCDISQGTSGINTVIENVVNIFSIIVGIVSVIMIIYGGFRYVTSGGDSGNVSSAKNTIIYAVIGLVVVALAQFIVQFVLDKVSPAA